LVERLRRETALTLPWIAARLQAGSWKSLAAKLLRRRKIHASPDPYIDPYSDRLHRLETAAAGDVAAVHAILAGKS
jgi:hypothetical protein